MKEKWDAFYDIEFIARRLQSIRDNIIHNLYYEIDNETGFAKYNPDTSEPILSGMSKKECIRIANGRISKIKKALKTLHTRHTTSTKFNFSGDIAYMNYYSGAYFLYHYSRVNDTNQSINIITVFDIHSDGAPIETLYPDLRTSSRDENFACHNCDILECLVIGRY